MAVPTSAVSPCWRRGRGALRLDSDTYAEVAGDESANAQAIAVFALTAAISIGLGRLDRVA